MFCLYIKREKIKLELIVRENESLKRFSPARFLSTSEKEDDETHKGTPKAHTFPVQLQ